MNEPPACQDDRAHLTIPHPEQHHAFAPLAATSSRASNNTSSTASSRSSSFSRTTSISQDEIQKLISIHVHQELSKYPSLLDDSDNADNINQHKFLKKIKANVSSFASRFDSYPPFCYIIRFQNWYTSKAEHNKFFELFGAAGWFALLYPFIIAGIVLGNTHGADTIVVFVCNILAIIPLSVIISYLTEALAELTNPTIGGLLNITFGNAIELIFSIMALFKGQLDTVQGSMVGSWLATTQLILGCAFFFASFNKKQLSFNKLNSYFNVIFMVFSGFVVKMVYSVNYNSNYTKLFKDSSSSKPASAVIKISTGFAVLHLLLYIVYLIIPYQHRKLLAKASHRKKRDLELSLFDNKKENDADMPSVVRFASTNRFEESNADAVSALSDTNTFLTGTSRSAEKIKIVDNDQANVSTNVTRLGTATSSINEPLSLVAATAPPPTPLQSEFQVKPMEQFESEQPPQETSFKSFWAKSKDLFIYGLFLLAITVVAAFNSDYLLDSLDDFSEETHIPKAFITVILIPIFSNAAEHVTSIIVAYKGQMELALNIAVGSAIQINFFIVPFLILIAHATKSPYTFLYENTYCETMFAASILASFCIWNGKAYFPTGIILLVNYICCATLIYFMV